MSEFHDQDFLSDIAESDRKEMEEDCSEYEYEAMFEDQNLRKLEDAREIKRDVDGIDDDYVRKLIYQGSDMSDYEAEQNSKYRLFWGL
jgi:hypothetical protein